MQDLAPALIESIKSAGLVLIADLSTQVPGAHLNHDADAAAWSAPGGTAANGALPERIDGFFKGNGVLRFNETVDI